MVRKIRTSIFVLLLFCLGLSLRTRASNSIYSSYIPDDLVTTFSNIVSKSSVFDDYVLYRSDENSFCLVVGDLKFDSGSFTAAEAEYFNIIIDTSGNYIYDSGNIDNFVLTVSDNLVYSNLGDYPTLIERSDIYEITQIFILIILCLSLYLRNWFKNPLR